ncbi:MAG TPA: peptide ABC transporter substrate-binding protein, partial [Holophaga sp.]|nr:peptide ABC transporter substrate-binding protein [Holophaga sp.]
MRPWLSTTLLAAAICATPVPAPGQPADKASRVVFTVNNEGAPRSLDPALMGGGRPEYRLYLALFEGLVVPDPETSLPRPGLAESWTASADMKTCTFRLRPARWSDGAGIKAQDVVDSWLRTLDPATQAVHLGDMLDAIPGARDFHEGKAPRGKVGIRAVDARTFEVSFTRPMPQAPFLLLEPCFGVVPLQAVRAFGKDWARPEHFVGNGPFVLAEWDSPERIVVDRNPYYWNAAQVGLDRIAFMAIDGQDDAYDQYAAGAFDWSPGIDGRRYAEIKERRDYQCVPGSAVYYFNVNTGRKPFNDARVRKALSMALDRTRVCEQVAGTGQMPTTDFVPPMPGFQLSTGSGYDPEGARRLLAEAGFPGGKGFPKFTVTYNAYVLHEQVAEWVAAQWKEVLGIQARLESLGWDIYRMRRLAHDFDICRAGWRATLAEPTEFLRPFRRDGEDNASRYASADVDALLDRATGLPLGAARDQVLREAAQDVVDRDQAVIPLFFYPAQDLIDLDRWEGWFPNTMGVHPWTSIRRRERGAALGARPPETPAGSPPGQAYVRT